MHATFLTALILPGLLLAAPLAISEERPAATATAADAEPAAIAKADDDNFVLPPGFKPMKRGKFILYCRKETVMGTRLPAQKCYDEDGIRQMAQSLREEREKIDQMRRICGQQAACGAN
jgi:hypothetical protein